MELITVIVPIYNVEKYLKNCVSSIINQTYENLEILLIDDGSTDSSGKVADELAKQDGRAKVFHKKNGGLSDARNYGIERAKGRYLSFVDSDDVISCKMIEVLYKNIKNNNADISICSYMEFRNISEVKDDNIDELIRVYDVEEAIKCLFDTESFGNFAWNKLYKKELFSEIRYPVGYKMEDIGTTYKLFCKCKKIVSTNEKLYYYLQRSNSILHKVDFKLKQDKYELEYERFKFLNKLFPNMFENYYYYFKSGVILYPYISKECQIQFENMYSSFKIFEYKKYLSFKDLIRFMMFKYFRKMYCKIKKGD